MASGSIKDFLPGEFIFSLGEYMQTCAHIELWSAALITCLRAPQPNSKEWFEDYCAARKLATSDLLRRLRGSNEYAEAYGFSSDLLALCDWLDQFKGNRHIAAHGAFFGSPNGFLRVEYVQNLGTRKAPSYQPTRTAITKELVDEAVQDARRIHLIVLGMIEKIEKGLTTKIVRTIIPIVEHPPTTQLP